eukprot:XP_001696131.1 predicted protein [Chlamydomonas reinhardtii]
MGALKATGTAALLSRGVETLETQLPPRLPPDEPPALAAPRCAVCMHLCGCTPTLLVRVAGDEWLDGKAAPPGQKPAPPFGAVTAQWSMQIARCRAARGQLCRPLAHFPIARKTVGLSQSWPVSRHALDACTFACHALMPH